MHLGIYAAFVVGALLSICGISSAIHVDLSSSDAIKLSAKVLAGDMLSHYHGNEPGQIPGNLPYPYYWWECGAMFGSLIDYWLYTGDSAHNDLVTQGMQFQVGPNNDFMPPNQTKTLGNDDQCFWALAAISAAESNFPNPPKDKPQWLALAQAVFNTQAQRWDKSTCGGGLKWQIYTFNNGYTYKNTISNGCYFNLGARLALYTRNDTYADWATAAWNWMSEVGLIDEEYAVFDGSDELKHCASINRVQWSYNVGILLNGAAAMYNYTGGTDTWRRHTSGLLKTTSSTFFRDKVMFEPACELDDTCNTDQLSFKAYLSRWMAATTKLAPFTYGTIKPLLRASAEAAMSHCNGGNNGRTCGLKWSNWGNWDGSNGIGQQMAALEVLQSNLIHATKGPVREEDGGTSQGNPSAGGDGRGNKDVKAGPWSQPAGTGDRVGAGALTAVMAAGVVCGVWWIVC
ncbi:hydrolase 76 protein [Pseudogymnoascus verrucosus]|uniref:Mannan endo-1,6-alpha-mannosidase n=1 Tax=Pseudogymnoascus verrucosus TaxID=342668 RepID=A0A1B8GPA6_9PEZI|nr:hydrolase 76 protein [Pseudogymnoascus verrucosus]OBT97648.2 hydrolase 76 protein [Pseudogymnoascus verrucosus]